MSEIPSIPVHVVSPDGETKTTVLAKTAEYEEQIRGDMTNGEVVLSREAWADVDDALTSPLDDVILIEDPRDGSDYVAGHFDGTERGDGTVTVNIEGFEVDAATALSTGPKVIYQNEPDSNIVADLINGNDARDLPGVPTLEAGTVETLAENLSMSFSNAEPAKCLRDTSEPTGGEFRFNTDQTVDYVQRLGKDKPEIVLSPGEQTIISDPEITQDARENYTHVEAYGAKSGEYQLSVTESLDTYEEGGRPNAAMYTNKEIKQLSRLEKVAQRLVKEYDGEPRHLEVQVETVDLDIQLGDRVTVQIPSEDIDRELRVMKRRSILGTAGVTLALTLSNRLLSDKDEGQKNREELQRRRRGDEGYVDRDIAPYGPEVAGDGTPREITVPNWPDDIAENGEIVVDLVVQGDAWRSPVTPEGHEHNVTITDHNHDLVLENHKHEISLADHEHDVTFTVPYHRHDIASERVETSVDEGHSHLYWQPDFATTPSDAEEETTTSDGGGGTETTSGAGGGTQTTTEGGGGTTETTTSSVPLSPEVTTQFEGETYYPTNVTIEVNGDPVAIVDGNNTSSWSETIDIRGELTPGENTITASPDTRGELNLILSTELFRTGSPFEQP